MWNLTRVSIVRATLRVSAQGYARGYSRTILPQVEAPSWSITPLPGSVSRRDFINLNSDSGEVGGRVMACMQLSTRRSYRISDGSKAPIQQGVSQRPTPMPPSSRTDLSGDLNLGRAPSHRGHWGIKGLMCL